MIDKKNKSLFKEAAAANDTLAATLTRNINATVGSTGTQINPTAIYNYFANQINSYNINDQEADAMVLLAGNIVRLIDTLNVKDFNEYTKLTFFQRELLPKINSSISAIDTGLSGRVGKNTWNPSPASSQYNKKQKILSRLKQVKTQLAQKDAEFKNEKAKADAAAAAKKKEEEDKKRAGEEAAAKAKQEQEAAAAKKKSETERQGVNRSRLNILCPGDKEAIPYLQQWLKYVKNYKYLKVDGVYGPKTHKAFMRFVPDELLNQGKAPSLEELRASRSLCPYLVSVKENYKNQLLPLERDINYGQIETPARNTAYEESPPEEGNSNQLEESLDSNKLRMQILKEMFGLSSNKSFKIKINIKG